MLPRLASLRPAYAQAQLQVAILQPLQARYIALANLDFEAKQISEVAELTAN